MLKTVAIIPCRNESKFVRKAVLSSKNYIDAVIVSDDGSTDSTIQEALSAGALVLHKPPHDKSGMGSATMRAVRHIVNSYDIIVTLDGDGQHNPDGIPEMLKPIVDGRADLVIGSRFVRTNKHNCMPMYRRLGNSVITGAFNMGSAARHVTDSQCCFRAYHSSVFKTVGTEFVETGFPFSIEVLIKARCAGFRIVDVPIECIYHGRLEDNSTMSPIRHGVSTLVSTIKWRLWETTHQK